MAIVVPQNSVGGGATPVITKSPRYTLFTSAAMAASSAWSESTNIFACGNWRLAHVTLKCTGNAGASGNIVRAMPLGSTNPVAQELLSKADMLPIGVSSGSYTQSTLTGAMPSGGYAVPLLGTAPLSFDSLVIVTPASASNGQVFFNKHIAIPIEGLEFFGMMFHESASGAPSTPATVEAYVRFTL